MKQRITTLVACGLLAFALIGVAAAGPLDDGQAAYQRGDLMEKRRRLMAEWADFCGRPVVVGDVVALWAAVTGEQPSSRAAS